MTAPVITRGYIFTIPLVITAGFGFAVGPVVNLPPILNAYAVIVQPGDYAAALTKPGEYTATLRQPGDYEAVEVET